METIVKRCDEFLTSKWSGGETTELFIYPLDSDYKKRDFLFRISSATVTDDKSVFTKLPQINRKLFVLEGGIKLTHNEKEGHWLWPNEQESFNGDWDTTSEGLVTDYNVMTKDGISSTIDPILLSSKDTENCLVYNKANKKCFLILYVWQGEISVKNHYEKKRIKTKELLVFDIKKETIVSGFDLINESDSISRIVKTIIYV